MHAHKGRKRILLLCGHTENTVQSSAFNSMTDALRHSFQQSAAAFRVSWPNKCQAEMVKRCEGFIRFFVH